MAILSRWPALAALACLAVFSARAQDELSPRVRAAEAKRVAVIEKVKPSVVAIFSRGGGGGGSGVLIDAEGYALTNFHVTAGAGNVMKCGLPDGILYDAVLVGLDKVGDVALIKLLPKKEGQKFPFAVLGDSDKLRAGDWSLAMGNPFLLATDFTPTVTFGLISGVHRYQEPSGVLLEYTDCIQIDTSINPGNSGGPLFNMQGELVGINGRGSFDKRTRINSGVGYAISINQIKNFMGHLRAGLDTDHASLGATVRDQEGELGSIPKMLISGILEGSDVSRRKLDTGDELVAFAGQPMRNALHYKNILGLYPRGWRVPMVYRHDEAKKEVLVRLMGVQRQTLEGEPATPPMPPRPPRPNPGGAPTPAPKPSPASKLFEAKPGFANYYFNKQEKERLWKAFVRHGDFSGLKGEWTLKGKGTADARDSDLDVVMRETDDKPFVGMEILGVRYDLEPLKTDLSRGDQMAPPKSGGLISALYLYRQLLVHGEKGFVGEFIHGGHEPFYGIPDDPAKPNYESIKVMCEVLRTRHAGVTTKWYFSLKDQRLLGFEVAVDKDEDPCEVYLADYQKVDGRMLARRIQVRHGDDTYADFKNVVYRMNAK